MKNNSVPGYIHCIYKSILSPNVLDLKSSLCERQYKKNSVTHGGSIILVSAANDTGYENLNADSDQDHASQDGCSPCKAGMVAKHGQSSRRG